MKPHVALGGSASVRKGLVDTSCPWALAFEGVEETRSDEIAHLPFSPKIAIRSFGEGCPRLQTPWISYLLNALRNLKFEEIIKTQRADEKNLCFGQGHDNPK